MKSFQASVLIGFLFNRSLHLTPHTKGEQWNGSVYQLERSGQRNSRDEAARLDGVQKVGGINFHDTGSVNELVRLGN